MRVVVMGRIAPWVCSKEIFLNRLSLFDTKKTGRSNNINIFNALVSFFAENRNLVYNTPRNKGPYVIKVRVDLVLRNISHWCVRKPLIIVYRFFIPFCHQSFAI